jgi:hypothetical protein
MRSLTLKININHLRGDIDRDYFKFKDSFYKCLIVNLCIYNTFHGNILASSIIEDSHYNQYLLYLANRQSTMEELIAEIDPVHATTIFLDSNIYLEEFINTKHDANVMNLYSLTIDDTYNIVITNKQLKRHHAQ